jgi:cellulose synthase/poly-beta-1,6-N-acetylglucosamine synthase-like glycosyltransferase
VTDFPENLLVEKLPKVTVIMPVRNEAEYIERSLGAVLRQDYPHDKFEVIVVDGVSADGTHDFVKEMASRFPKNNIRLLNNDKHIFSTGFNIGLSQAGGEVIIMLGGHTRIAQDYVQHCVKHLGNHGIDCVGGNVETIGETFQSKVIALAMSSHFGVGGVVFRTGSKRLMEVDTVAFGAYKRSAIHRCGPMDEEMVKNQDDEYNYRLREIGGRIVLAPEIRCRYYSRASLLQLWRQYFQYGYWKVRVMQKHPRQMRLRHFIPSVFVASIFGSVLLAPFLDLALILFLLISGCYVSANLFASIITSFKKGWNYLPLLPITFATLHFSYGLGFLVGLVRFFNRWEDRSSPTWADISKT